MSVIKYSVKHDGNSGFIDFKLKFRRSLNNNIITHSSKTNQQDTKTHVKLIIIF